MLLPYTQAHPVSVCMVMMNIIIVIVIKDALSSFGHTSTYCECMTQSSSPTATSCSPLSENFSYKNYQIIMIMILIMIIMIMMIMILIIMMTRYAPLGDLTSNITEAGLGEQHTKRVAKQVNIMIIS